MSRTSIAALLLMPTLLLGGCTQPEELTLGSPPTPVVTTPTRSALRDLPPPVKPVPVAVYRFDDETGQHKPNEAYSDYSRAVSQGGAAILVETLLQAGNSKWFRVLERASLGNLLQERKIVDTTRSGLQDPSGRPLPPLGPMMYAGIILEGGIIGYDSNVMTGGMGARYLGVGASTEYRRDVVTVALRAASVQTGEVLAGVSVAKTIFSVGAQGSVYSFIGFNDLLEIETGFTSNEPVMIATRQAIEKAVLDLIAEGAMRDLWAFADMEQARPFLSSYVRQRDGEDAELPERLFAANEPRQSPPGRSFAPTRGNPRFHLRPLPGEEGPPRAGGVSPSSFVAGPQGAPAAGHGTSGGTHPAEIEGASDARAYGI